MIDPESQATLKREIAERMRDDRRVLDKLRAEVRPLRGAVRRIQPRNTTAISLVGADGGNNSLRFDPFLIQIVCVVDSSNNEYCLQALTPTTRVSQLGARQFTDDCRPATSLGALRTVVCPVGPGLQAGRRDRDPDASRRFRRPR